MPTSSLSFTLRVARSEQDLRDACSVRAQAYGHHLPSLIRVLAEPDAIDRHPGTAVLACRDKASGQLIGTARVQRGAPLQLEASVPLPPSLTEHTRAEITRLAVLPGADPLLRPMLMKASYLFCLASQIRWLVIGARSPALIRIYQRLGFRDVLDNGEQVPLAHAGGLPHSILSFDVVAAERIWHGLHHSLYPLMVETFHPDLQLFNEPAELISEPRRQAA